MCTKHLRQSLPLALLLFLLFAFSPIATASAHSAHKAISVTAHVNIVQRGHNVNFTAKRATCHALQPTFCIITVNTTDKPIDIYFDGKYLLTLNAGTDMGTEFSSYETHVYTMPLTNSRASLTVTAKP